MRESNYTFAEGFGGMPNEQRYEVGMRQMDWDALKASIDEFIPQGLVAVEVGLKTDWAHTSGEVWRDGKYIPPSETYTFTASTWAVPAAVFTFADGHEEEREIWKRGKNASDYFPKELWNHSVSE